MGTLNANTERFVRLWKHNPTGKWMSAVLRRHCIVGATDALSRGRTPDTRSAGLETTKALLV